MNKIKQISARFLSVSFAVLLSVFTLSAQQRTITGTITGADGEPLPGASVIVKGTTNGAFADLDGKYSISAPVGSVLEYSFVGFLNQEVTVADQSVVNIVLQEDADLLDEIFVVGYAVGNKRTVSGAVERVKAEEMNDGFVSNPLDAIRGKIPGMVISSAGGNFNSSPTVRIRGTSSLSGGSDPLVIVDGVFSSMDVLERLNQQDIEEITVLKDASETAQYGSRGAAGVIVVTTVRGQDGTSNVTYNGQVGLSHAFKNLEVLSADEWRTFSREHAGGAGTDMGFDTNWIEWLQRDVAMQNNHSVSLSHGSSRGNIRASIGMNNRQNIVRNSNFQNYNARVNVSQYVFDRKLRLDFNMSGNYRQMENPRTAPFAGALSYNPTFPSERNPETGVWDVDAQVFNATHPGEALEGESLIEASEVNVNGRATYTIIPGLTASAFGSFTYNTNVGKNYTPNDLSGSSSYRGSAGVTNRQNKNLMGSVQLNYDKTLGKHAINALALVEGQVYNSFNSGITVNGFETNYFKYNNLEAGAVINWGNATSGTSRNSLLSYMGRINYMYADKYVLTANLRADGSSKLGANNKWGFFPSASAAWIITNEEFMKNQQLFSNLKLRVGYGVTGNQDAISAYNSIEVLQPNGVTNLGGQSVTTYGIIQNSNPDLRWEKKYTFDVGLDFSMIKGGRLRGTIDYYRSTTKDMLYTYNVPVPPFTYPTLLANMGEMTNNGFEVALTGVLISKKDMRLTVTGNAAFNKNKLVSLHGTYNGEELTTSEWVTLASATGNGLTSNTQVTFMGEGYPVGIFRLPVFNGFETDAEGKRHYTAKSHNEDGTVDSSVNSADREILGQAIPKVTSSFNVQFDWKQFTVSTQLTGAFGHKIYNFTSMANSNLEAFPTYNVLKTAPEFNVWGIPYHNSYWLEKGDYVHLEYITLGYNIPTKGKVLSNARVSLSCNNIATFTGYSGLTPMINSQSINGGVDARNVYPLMRTYTLQLMLTF